MGRRFVLVLVLCATCCGLAIQCSRFRAEAEAVARDIERKLPPEERRRLAISRQFGADGAHREVTRAIKEAMHDPSSFVNVDTRYIDSGDDLTVTCTFRGKNGFGAVVTQTVIATVDIDGTVLSLKWVD